MLRAIFYSEFDNTLGPRVLYDAPHGSVSKAFNLSAWRSYAEQWQHLRYSSMLTTRRVAAAQQEPQATALFEAVNDYCITGPQLSGHLITVLVPALGMLVSPQRPTECVQVVNYPLAIRGSKYGRNALLFNLGLVLHEHAPAQLFTSALRKLSMTLQSMELESEFLSTPSMKESLGLLLPRVLRDLNATGECTLALDARNLLSIKLPTSAGALLFDSGGGGRQSSDTIEDKSEGDFSHSTAQQERARPLARAPAPVSTHPAGAWGTAHAMANQRLIPEVKEHHVPCLLVNPEELEDIDWDITVERVIRFIDGAKCAKEIAVESGVDSDRCRASLRVLLWHGCLVVVDLFRYSNVYALRPGVAGLLEAGPLPTPKAGRNDRSRRQDPRRVLVETLAMQHAATLPTVQEQMGSGMGIGERAVADDIQLTGSTGASAPTSSIEGRLEGDFGNDPEEDEMDMYDIDDDLIFNDCEWWTDEVLNQVAALPLRKWRKEQEEARRAKQQRRERRRRRRAQRRQQKLRESEMMGTVAANQERGELNIYGEARVAATGIAASNSSSASGAEVRGQDHGQVQEEQDPPPISLGERASSALGAAPSKKWLVPVGSMLNEALQYSAEAVREGARATQIAASRHALQADSYFHAQQGFALSSSPGQRAQVSVSGHSPQSYRIGSYNSVLSGGSGGDGGDSDSGNVTLHENHSSSSSSSSSSLSSSFSSSTTSQVPNQSLLPPRQNVPHNLFRSATFSRSAPKPPLVPSQQMVGQQQRWQNPQQTPPSPHSRPQNAGYKSAQRQQPWRQQEAPTPYQGSPKAPISVPFLDHDSRHFESTSLGAPSKSITNIIDGTSGALDVLEFYRGFGSGETVRRVVLESEGASLKDGGTAGNCGSMDHRRLIAFGLLNGILQRVHVFPICEVPKAQLPAVLADATRLLAQSSGDGSITGVSGVGSTGGSAILKELVNLMDGENSMDAICTKFFITDKRVRAMVQLLSDVQPPGSPSISYVYK